MALRFSAAIGETGRGVLSCFHPQAIAASSAPTLNSHAYSGLPLLKSRHLLRHVLHSEDLHRSCLSEHSVEKVTVRMCHQFAGVGRQTRTARATKLWMQRKRPGLVAHLLPEASDAGRVAFADLSDDGAQVTLRHGSPFDAAPLAGQASPSARSVCLPALVMSAICASMSAMTSSCGMLGRGSSIPS